MTRAQKIEAAARTLVARLDQPDVHLGGTAAVLFHALRAALSTPADAPAPAEQEVGRPLGEVRCVTCGLRGRDHDVLGMHTFVPAEHPDPRDGGPCSRCGLSDWSIEPSGWVCNGCGQGRSLAASAEQEGCIACGKPRPREHAAMAGEREKALEESIRAITPTKKDSDHLTQNDFYPFLGESSWALLARARERIRALASPPAPAEQEVGQCPAEGSPTEAGRCHKCGCAVEPSPCHCGKSHTGVYCWPCHHKNVRSCAAPHCPEHGHAATVKWLEENAPPPRPDEDGWWQNGKCQECGMVFAAVDVIGKDRCPGCGWTDQQQHDFEARMNGGTGRAPKEGT